MEYIVIIYVIVVIAIVVSLALAQRAEAKARAQASIDKEEWFNTLSADEHREEAEKALALSVAYPGSGEHYLRIYEAHTTKAQILDNHSLTNYIKIK